MPIDPRIAARWVSVRRGQRRKRRRATLGVLVVISAVAGTWALARSPLLAARHVVVRGIRHTRRSAVLVAAGLDRHPPLFDVDAAAIRRRILALPWVAEVDVVRDWPSTVTIDITERLPVAQVVGSSDGGQVAVVDGAGRVLAVGADAAQLLAALPSLLPTLVGVPLAGPPGSWLGPGSQPGLAVLAALRGPLISQVRGVSFTVASVTDSSNGEVRAALSSPEAAPDGGITVVFGAADQLAAKVTALRSVMAQLGPGARATIDVEVADVPVLTTGPIRTSLSTTQRG